eukprot:GABV01000227.1.p1 GENE.GABV01000227.1~~GABV01000227.1.p1  ORF type:complete len:534 (-),score=98.57 GABV01000227.1:3-1604(-)
MKKSVLTLPSLHRRFVTNVAPPRQQPSRIRVGRRRDGTCDSQHHGQLWSWGGNVFGAVGNGSYDDQPEPSPVPLTTPLRFRDISAGWGHSSAVTTDGEFVRWGWMDDDRSMFNAIRLSRFEPSYLLKLRSTRLPRLLSLNAADLEPKIIAAPPGGLDKGDAPAAVFAGFIRTFVVTEQGKVFVHGRSDNSALGLGDVGRAYVPSTSGVRGFRSIVQNAPEMVEFFNIHDIPVYKISVGRAHTLFQTVDGDVWVVGKGNDGQLGIGGPDFLYQNFFNPNRHNSLTVDNVQCLQQHLLREAESQIANGMPPDGYIPEIPPEFEICQSAAGIRHSLFLLSDGSVWGCGYARSGELGAGSDVRSQYWPTRIAALDEHRIVRIAAGSHHSVALSDDGRVFTWGMNKHGQCGRSFEESIDVEEWDRIRSRYPPRTSLMHDTSPVVGPGPDPEATRHLPSDPVIMPVGEIDTSSFGDVVDVIAGHYETVLLLGDGRVVTFGSERHAPGTLPLPQFLDFRGHRVLHVAYGGNTARFSRSCD